MHFCCTIYVYECVWGVYIDFICAIRKEFRSFTCRRRYRSNVKHTATPFCKQVNFVSTSNAPFKRHNTHYITYVVELCSHICICLLRFSSNIVYLRFFLHKFTIYQLFARTNIKYFYSTLPLRAVNQAAVNRPKIYK